ncbi:putative S-adenosyl-L-methionine-dependent methyltransferase, Methyltransferase domain 25 [Septoria linicola]|nr:putative S-adenosyl-L-methionine-dependent methyltransferase, Methyltransferase domain 25 [Septoria linicola]
MFAAPLRLFRPAVERNPCFHIETLRVDQSEILDGTELKSANFDPDPIELGDNKTLHSYLDPLYREKSPVSRSPTPMSTQYNQIGTKHKSLEDSPIGEVDYETTSRALGDVKGLKILDLACGIGRWSKYLVQHGAREVYGIDISDAMIKGAKDMQAGLPADQSAKLRFSTADCSLPLQLEDKGSYDLVLGAWYLSYAPDHATMVQMFTNILTSLRPGGRFLGVVPNAFCSMFEGYDIYGLRMEASEEVAPGHWKCRLQYRAGDLEFQTTSRLHGWYDKAASEAGMSEITWKPYILPKGDDREEKGFWDAFKLRPHFALLECYRPA